MGRVHHLNCGTMCPRGARMLAGHGGWLEPAKLVAHCLLVEAGGGLVLVDTGLGTGDAADPNRLGRPFRALVRPLCDEGETALRQVQALGFDPRDVTDIVVTHLDLDHAGGLGDFPRARVHLHASELEAALHPSLRERSRYVGAQWAHGPEWKAYSVEGDEWMGFESARLLPDLDTELALVPLLGHTRGHSGVAIRDGDGWLLHCGDAFFHRGTLESPPAPPPGLRLFERLNAWNGELRDRNQERLRELSRERASDVRLICSHDEQMLDVAPPSPSRRGWAST